MDGSRTLFLEKFDLFKIMSCALLIGILFHEYIPLIVPLRYPIEQRALLTIVGMGFACYLIGHRVRNRLGVQFGHRQIAVEEPNALKQFTIAMLIFVPLLVFGASLFMTRGVPMFADTPEQAAAIKTALNVRALGRTRAIDVLLPFTALYCVGLCLRYPCRRHAMAIATMMCLCCLSLLFLKAGKGNIFKFLFGLVYLFDLNSDREIKLFSVRTICLMLLGAFVMVGAFHLSEGQDWIHSMLYVMDRFLVYSWEGLNYIVHGQLPPDIKPQLLRFLSLGGPGASPDILLARQMTHNPNASFGVIPTLFGFLYRNGGLTLVALGFFALGFGVRELFIRMHTRRHDILAITTCYYLFLMLFTMFLVGDVFDEIRGLGLSVLVIYLMFRILESLRWKGLKTESIKPVNRKAAKPGGRI